MYCTYILTIASMKMFLRNRQALFFSLVMPLIILFIFGSIDLFAQTPFMLKYEAVITNIVTGIAFVAGARGAKPMLQEIAERGRRL